MSADFSLKRCVGKKNTHTHTHAPLRSRAPPSSCSCELEPRCPGFSVVLVCCLGLFPLAIFYFIFHLLPHTDFLALLQWGHFTATTTAGILIQLYLTWRIAFCSGAWWTLRSWTHRLLTLTSWTPLTHKTTDHYTDTAATFCSGVHHTLGDSTSSFYNTPFILPFWTFCGGVSSWWTPYSIQWHIFVLCLLHIIRCSWVILAGASSGTTTKQLYALLNNLATDYQIPVSKLLRAFCGGANPRIAFCGGALSTPVTIFHRTAQTVIFTGHNLTAFCGGVHTPRFQHINFYGVGSRILLFSLAWDYKWCVDLFRSTDFLLDLWAIGHFVEEPWFTLRGLASTWTQVFSECLPLLQVPGGLQLDPRATSTCLAFCSGALWTLERTIQFILFYSTFEFTFSTFHTFCSGVYTLILATKQIGVGSLQHFSLAQCGSENSLSIYFDWTWWPFDTPAGFCSPWVGATLVQQFERIQQQNFFRAQIFFQRGSLRQNRPQLWSQVQRCPRLATPFSGLCLPYNICRGTQGRGLDPCHGGFWSSTDMDLMLLSSWSEATWHAASDGLRPQHLDQSRK